jgi:hypothetical protein
MAQTDLRSLPRNDQLFLGLGVLVLITSFLPWYGSSYSTSFLGRHIDGSYSTNAWHGLAAFGIILMLIATALVLVQLMTDTTLPELRVSWNIVIIALDALGALFIIIKSFDLPHGSVAGISIGLRWGGWLLILAAVAQVVVGGLRFRESGEPMPWAGHGGSTPPDSPPAV